MAKFVIIDGNSLLFRAYYATFNIDETKLMRNHNNVVTNAIFAFSNMLTQILKSLKEGDGIFVAFDKGKQTFRHKEYKEYKANRPPCPTHLLTQMPLARELLDSLNIKYYETDNLEADDLAGIIAKKAADLDYNVEIYTSDKDYLQLINDKITINLIKKGLKDIHVMTPSSFKEEWGFDPIQILDYKGMMGDPSDNLKGIPGIGDKRAKSLIKEYNSLENVIENAINFKNKLGENILNFKDDGLMCKHLAIIRSDISIPLEIKDLIYKGYDFEKISLFAKEYDLNTLINKLPKDKKINQNIEKKVTYKEINEFNFTNLKEIGIGLDLEKINYHDAKLYGISLYIENEVYYYSLEFLKNSNELKNVLNSSEIKKYVFDFKKIYCVLNKENIKINGLYFDLLLANYLLESSIKDNLESVLNFNHVDISYAYDQSNALFIENNALESAIEAYYSYTLASDLILKLKEKDQYDLLINIEQPLSIVLASMEIEGFPINKESLLEFKEIYKGKIEDLSKEIYFLANEEFNINSPKQVKEILFNKLNLPDFKKGSTSIEALLELEKYHPIISKIIEYRKYFKMLSTYVEGYLPYIKEDNKIHTTFNQALTQTGRLSSSEPNLQNISIRNEETRQIRKAFFYNDDINYLLSFDYSQIELRILAHLANSETLINVFNANKDIHSETARKIFFIPQDIEVNDELRRKAKAVNFGIVYGISDWGLSEQLDIPLKESKQIISSFYNEFSEIKDYLNKLIESAKELGYASTMFNRRRYIEEINSENYQTREFAKRAATNAPIQGSAADIIKIVMIKIHEALIKGGYQSRLILQIHDEVILKVPKNELDEVYKLVKDIMENSIDLKVKLKVDGGYAKTWFDAK